MTIVPLYTTPRGPVPFDELTAQDYLGLSLAERATLFAELRERMSIRRKKGA